MNQRLESALIGSLALFLWFTAGAQLPDKVGDTPVPSLAPMIKKVAPAVVNIATRGTIQEQGGRNPLLDDPFFRRFFEVPDTPRERQFQSAGSGVIIDAKNGYVITNAHVVQNATEITVTLLDNRNLKAEVVGTDPGSDVAVLKIKAAGLADVQLADSSRAEVGDFVVAIGNPFALGQTVTFGIVSALGRSGINPDGIEDFIQTDASINPGNSGGALVNLRGELVGVNSAILSRGGGNIGIGFAIPSNMVKAVMEQLIKFGTVSRGVLGIAMAPALTPDVVKSLGAGNAQGALISQVIAGSAADQAGIKPGDIITSVNGRPVRSPTELRLTIGLLRVGDKVDIGIVREGHPRSVTATVGDKATTSARSAAEIHLGLDGAELIDAGDNGGVIVKSVAQRSPAEQNGLHANDLILGVGRARIGNLEQLKTAIAKAGGQFAMTLQRGNMTIVTIIQ